MNREDHLCWFHGKISRERAEEVLRKEGKGDGVFLVRDSTTSPGDFVLSVLHENEVWHYQIRRHGDDAFFSINDNAKIHGLDSLIEHYQKASNGLVTQLSAIIKQDPPPNDSRSHGRTNLLHRATKESNQTVVSELLKTGYRNFDAKNQDGQTAIHLACIYSNEDILQLLLNAGANVNCRDTAGNTPLHYACRSKSANFVRTLIKAKANIQMRNIDSGCVPLHDAAKFGNFDAVNVLLEADAPHMCRTKSGEFPSDLAAESGHLEIVEYLKNFTPKPPQTTQNQWYHGTLERNEAVQFLQQFADELIKKHKEENSNSTIETINEDLNESIEENGNVNLIGELDTSGIFLIRYSSRSGYVLTLWSDNQARNFIIQNFNKFLYIDEGPFLPSLEHLVQHYITFSDGLPVNLKYPVAPRPKPPLPFISTMPKSTSKKHQQFLRAQTADVPLQQQYIPKRNLSHPGDEAMNHVGLFENGAGSPPSIQSLSTSPNSANKKQQKDKRDMAIFRSLKSPRKNVIIDGMRSLRKAKKSPSKDKVKLQENIPTEEVSERREDPEETLKAVEISMQNLCFSTDFINLSGVDSVYNVPKNNCAIYEIDIGEKKSNGKPGNIPELTEKEEIAKESNQLESNETEEDYYTKSDKVIERERFNKELNGNNNEEGEYFIDEPPPPINMKTYPMATITVPSNNNAQLGYIPTADIRVFIEDNFHKTRKVLAEESAELREFSMHPERLDSIISTASNDSEFSGFFNRQNSNLSTSTENRSKQLNYFIPNECLILEKIVGEGEFGSVYNGILTRLSNEKDNFNEVKIPVAIKTLRDDHCRTNKQEFLREASVMIGLKHHCIVNLIGISKGKTAGLMMVQELVPLGSMLNFIMQNGKKINPNYELKIWASQIACGMQYLEAHHFVHRDLAARNILLASRNQAKISDFGLSRALGSDNECYQASQGGKWPIKWYAPESFNHGYFSHASDVWSFGVTLWEMFSLGQAPYGDIRGVDAIKLIEDGKRLSQPQLCPDNVYKIMENCWNYKPKDRPTFRYLSEYFARDPDYQNLIELVKTEHIS